MNQINPHQHFDRYRYAWEWVPENTENLLDYGCFNGEFIDSLKFKVKHLFGADVNEEVICKARKDYPYINFFIVDDSEKIDFPDNFFDIVTILDVMEHVSDENKILRELYRVLKYGGLLILSAPHKGAFGFCDSGNIKFRFPKLHKFIYFHILKEKNYYTKRFADKNSNLIGDISISEKTFHKHYSLKDIQKLFCLNFTIIKFIRFGLFARLIAIIHYTYQRLLHRQSKILKTLDSLDQSGDFGCLADSIILLARKQ